MSKRQAAGAAIIVLVFLGAVIFFMTPGGRAAVNNYFFSVQKADDATNYNTKKKVEDTARAMIASYEADKLTWQQYKDDENDEKASWADQAKMRANRTAANYNNYILENSFIWSGNIPEDILEELPYLE